jgi:ferritin-like protein
LKSISSDIEKIINQNMLGKTNNKDNQLKILVDSLEELSQKEADKPKPLKNFVELGEVAVISIPHEATDTDLAALKLLLATNKGEIETYVLLPNGGLPKRVKMPFDIEFSAGLVDEINALLSRRS